MKPADLANMLLDLPEERRLEVAANSTDDRARRRRSRRCPRTTRSQILDDARRERAADILEEMEPDDAADLLAELPGAGATSCSS